MHIFVFISLCLFVPCLANHSGLTRRVNTPPQTPRRASGRIDGSSSPNPKRPRLEAQALKESTASLSQTHNKLTSVKDYRTVVGGPYRQRSPPAADARIESNGRNKTQTIDGLALVNGAVQPVRTFLQDPVDHPRTVRHIHSTGTAAILGQAFQNGGCVNLAARGTVAAKCELHPGPRSRASYSAIVDGVEHHKIGRLGEHLSVATEVIDEGNVEINAQLKGPGGYLIAANGPNVQGRTPSPGRE